MSALENEIDRSLSNGFWGVWFRQNRMLGDSVLTALEKMKQTDQQQHSNGLLQEFYAMTQRYHKPKGWYAVRLDMAAGKVQLQSWKALGGTPEEWGRLLVDCLLRSFDEAKKMRDSTLKPKATTHFCFDKKKSTLPATLAVRMVAPAPEEGSGEGEATLLPSKESDSGES